MNERCGQNTVPRPFIDSRLIGGRNELATLQHPTELADLLGTEAIELTRETIDT
jgi:glutaredoxin-related protein